MRTPAEAVPAGFDPRDLGPLETWQLWCGTNSDQGIVQVTAPSEMLPYAIVREAFEKRLLMHVWVEALPVEGGGGVRLRAEQMPVPEKKAPSEVAVKIAAENSADPEAVQAMLDKSCEPTNPCAECKEGLLAISEDNEVTP